MRPCIRIVCVGSLKEKYWTKAVEQYARDIRKWAQLEIIEVNGEKVPDKRTGFALDIGPTLTASEKNVLDREASALLNRIGEKDYVAALEIGGRPMTSAAFSRLLYERTNIVFLIGGTLGLGEAAVNRADTSLSFSGLTFPHQLMRVILLEQIRNCAKAKESY